MLNEWPQGMIDEFIRYAKRFNRKQQRAMAKRR